MSERARARARERERETEIQREISIAACASAADQRDEEVEEVPGGSPILPPLSAELLCFAIDMTDHQKQHPDLQSQNAPVV